MSSTLPTPPTATPANLPDKMQVLLTEAEIQARIQDIADEMNVIYQDTEHLVIICILKGAFMFMSDLVKRLNFPCHVEFIRLASYEGQKSSGTVKPVDLSLPSLNDKDVLLVEDIIDTGLTLSFFMDYISSLHTPKSLRLAVMLDKKEARQKPVETHFVGFEIANLYVVGYGLDDEGLHRNLPYIAHYVG